LAFLCDGLRPPPLNHDPMRQPVVIGNGTLKPLDLPYGKLALLPRPVQAGNASLDLPWLWQEATE
jgi:hypothetical protein